jgi:hypothetical protein
MPCFACKGPSPSAGSGDIIDAALIAACTAAVETCHAPPDSRFATLAEHLTFIEQIEEDIARGKTRREGYQTPELEAAIETEISRPKSAAGSTSNASSPSCAPMPISPTRSFPMESSLGRIVWPPENRWQPHKLALVACARRLLIFANTLLTRETPWTPKKPVKITST